MCNNVIKHRWQRTRTERPANRLIPAHHPFPKDTVPTRSWRNDPPSLTTTLRSCRSCGVLSALPGEIPKSPQTLGQSCNRQWWTQFFNFPPPHWHFQEEKIQRNHTIRNCKRSCVWTAHKHRTPAGTGEKDQVRKLITKGFTFIQPQEGMSSLVTDSNMTQKCHLADPAL